VSTPAPTHVPTTNGTAEGSGARRLGPDIHAIVRACKEEGRVRAVFQPIVDLRTGAMCGFEALARFPMYRPDEWFRAAADSGMSGWFETTILRTALNSLPELPDFLKLERSLVSSINDAPALQKAAGAAVALAGQLGADVVAQGIETEGEIETIVGLGIAFGQGFAFGHALPQLRAHAHRHEQTIKRLSA
jgi:EAL domain-containing protein (putative c-di-GMP-specific phosphodiesterase class I)